MTGSRDIKSLIKYEKVGELIDYFDSLSKDMATAKEISSKSGGDEMASYVDNLFGESFTQLNKEQKKILLDRIAIVKYYSSGYQDKYDNDKFALSNTSLLTNEHKSALTELDAHISRLTGVISLADQMEAMIVGSDEDLYDYAQTLMERNESIRSNHNNISADNKILLLEDNLHLSQAKNIRNGDQLRNINSYDYLANITDQIKTIDSELKNKYRVIKDLEDAMSKNRPYNNKYAYGDLYTKFLYEFEKELKANDTLKNQDDLNALKEVIKLIYANPNHSLERSAGMIADVLKAEVHTSHQFEDKVRNRLKGNVGGASLTSRLANEFNYMMRRGKINKKTASPEQQGAKPALFANMLAPTFLPQTTTSMASIRTYDYKNRRDDYPEEYRFGTQGQYHTYSPETSYMFECWLTTKRKEANKGQTPPPKTRISHIYFNNLGRDRSGDYEGYREKELTTVLEELEKRHSNVAVITLPADKGFMDVKLLQQHDKMIEDAYFKMFEVATGRSDEKVQDFYISDEIKKLLYGESSDGSYDKSAEKSKINELILLSFEKLGFKASDKLSPAEFQAVYFHFIKYELSKYIIETLNPDSFNMSCKDAIDRGGVSSAYYNLMLSLEHSNGNPDFAMSREEFDRALHAAPTLVKGRAMNHHIQLVWNAVNAYINNNINRNDHAIPAWLIIWRNDNQPEKAVASYSKRSALSGPDTSKASVTENASIARQSDPILVGTVLSELLDRIQDHYGTADHAASTKKLKISDDDKSDATRFSKKNEIIEACNKAQAQVDQGNYYAAYEILNDLANSSDFKKKTRFEVRENYFLNSLKEMKSEVRKAEMQSLMQKKSSLQASSSALERLTVPEPAEVARSLTAIGVLTKESEFEDFLERRRCALNYNEKAAKSEYVKSQEKITRNEKTVYSYYDNNEYQPGISHAKYASNLYLMSVNGGRSVTNAYNEDQNNRENPLKLNHCPQSNIMVAPNQVIASHGGYFSVARVKYDKPKSATIMHAYAYEFENYTAKEIAEGKCPFIKKQKPDEWPDKNNFSQLNFSVDQSDKFDHDYGRVLMVKNEPRYDDMRPGDLIALKEDGQLTIYWLENGKLLNRSFSETAVQSIMELLPKTNEESTNPNLIKLIKSQYNCNISNLYLDNSKYKELIKKNLLNQMRAVVHAHQQSGLMNNIQINLNLPGMGFFSCLGAEERYSIREQLAPLAAQAYKEALELFHAEQKNRIPKITAIRMTYDGRTDNEVNAITRAFNMGDTDTSMVGDITIRKTNKLVENLDSKPGVVEVVCVNGDPRTYPGNEPPCSSQEPGVYSNVVNGRNNLSVINKPFAMAEHSYTHTKVLTSINENIQQADQRAQNIQSLQLALEKQQYVHDHPELRILPELRFIAHHLSNANAGIRLISSLLAVYEKKADMTQSDILFNEMKQACIFNLQKSKDIRSRFPDIDLLLRTIAEYEANIKFINIKTMKNQDLPLMAYLLIAQQKRDAIAKLRQEQDKLKNSEDVIKQLKYHAYENLIGGINHSKINEPLSDVMKGILNKPVTYREKQSTLVYPINDFNKKLNLDKNSVDSEANITIQQALDVKLGFFKSKSSQQLNDLLNQKNPLSFGYMTEITSHHIASATPLAGSAHENQDLVFHAGHHTVTVKPAGFMVNLLQACNALITKGNKLIDLNADKLITSNKPVAEDIKTLSEFRDKYSNAELKPELQGELKSVIASLKEIRSRFDDVDAKLKQQQAVSLSHDNKPT